MVDPFEGLDARRRAVLEPISENLFRLIDSAVDASDAQLVASLGRACSAPGRALLCVGPKLKTAEIQALVQEKGGELEVPARLAVAALFHPWLRTLKADAAAIPFALHSLEAELRQRSAARAVGARLARELLPRRPLHPPSAPERQVAPQLFQGDLDPGEILGPLPEAKAPGGGLFSSLARTPSVLSGAMLAATRLGRTRRLHAGYLRSLLADADAGDPGAARRLSEVARLFDEVEAEAAGPWVLGWRALLDGRREAASAWLGKALRSRALTADEKEQVAILLARVEFLRSDARVAISRLRRLRTPGAMAVWAIIRVSAGETAAPLGLLIDAWEEMKRPKRWAPAVVMAALVQGDQALALKAASRLPESGWNGALARAWLEISAGRGEMDALRSLRTLRPDAPGPRYAIAALSPSPSERAASRQAFWELIPEPSELAEAALVRGALDDGAWDQVRGRIPRIMDPELRALALDATGRRTQAWKLRKAGETQIRDQARVALDAGQARVAFRVLAGVPLSDSLRRRAARLAVLEVLTNDPDQDVDTQVRKTLGEMTPAELASLDLPTHLFEAVRWLEDGSLDAGVAALRQHLDSETDPRATLLLQSLTGGPNPGDDRAEAALDALILSLAGRDPSADLSDIALNDESVSPPVWEAAVIRCARRGLTVDTGTFEGGSDALRIAAVLMRCRRGLSQGDWSMVAASLGEVPHIPALRDLCAKALVAVHAREFPEFIRSDPAAALAALERRGEGPVEAPVLHDRALWRTVELLRTPREIEGSSIGPVLEGWEDARRSGGLASPAHPAPEELLLGELTHFLVSVLTLVAPAQAELARAAIVERGGVLGERVLSLAGWSRSGA